PALLLRIDSPGGTVGDSQEIYAALQRLRDAIPVVASFGNIAASGGVYIGVGARHIVANPGTITGSIGVILRGNNLERLLEKVGVSFKVVKSGPYKDILAFDRELRADEERILQELIDTTYQQFIQTVAKARRLSLDTVRSFADGRIFSGEQALTLGVVDRLGSEEDARRWLIELAGLHPQAQVVEFGRPRLRLGRLLPATHLLDQLEFTLQTQGIPLWLYLP
ncbi:MAG: signal peptide peptidase SppA, partial [Thermostichales cyanobacterium GMQP_bins_62]